MSTETEAPISLVLPESCDGCMGGLNGPQSGQASLLFLREHVHKCSGCKWFADLYIPNMLGLLAIASHKQDAGEEWSTRVRRLRQQMGYSQAQLAQQLGVRREQIARWENGHHNPGDAAQQGLLALEAGVAS